MDRQGVAARGLDLARPGSDRGGLHWRRTARQTGRDNLHVDAGQVHLHGCLRPRRGAACGWIGGLSHLPCRLQRDGVGALWRTRVQHGTR